MIIMLNLQYNQYLGIPVTPDTGALLAALALARRFELDYQKGTYQLVTEPKSGKTFEINLVDETTVVSPTPLMDTITEAAKRAESQWLAEHTKRMAVEKELKDLKDKLAGINPPKSDGHLPVE